MYSASGVYYLNPTFWISNWQNPFQGEWIYFLQFLKLVVTQKNKFIGLFHCFPWCNLKWKHEYQLFEFLREKLNYFMLSIQNKFWSSLLMMWWRCLRKFQPSISEKLRTSPTFFFLFKNSGEKKWEENTRTPKYFVEKRFYKIYTELVKSHFTKHKLIIWIFYCW